MPITTTVIPQPLRVTRITSDFFDSASAAKSALSAQHELYHFQMVIREYGEERVLQETAAVLRERYRYTHTEAYGEAAIRIRALLELCKGDKTFRTVRDNLRGYPPECDTLSVSHSNACSMRALEMEPEAQCKVRRRACI